MFILFGRITSNLYLLFQLCRYLGEPFGKIVFVLRPDEFEEV